MGFVECFVIFLAAGFGNTVLAKSETPADSFSFCEDYIRCMEQLEVKQHECLSLEKIVRLRLSNSCLLKKWDLKLELNALHMRRAEVARDCVQKNHRDSKIAESTLDEDARKQCTSVHRKFQFARNSTSVLKRKKRSSSKRTKREMKKYYPKATECRHSAKIWHKQCSALAKCCPLAEECKQSTKEIMEQIYEGRHKLRDLHKTC